MEDGTINVMSLKNEGFGKIYTKEIQDVRKIECGKELQDSYKEPYIVGVVKRQRMRWIERIQ